MNQVEIAVFLHQFPGVGAGVLEGRNGSGDNAGTGARELRRDKADARHVLVAVGAGETELGAESGADGLAQQQRDGAAALLVQSNLQGAGHGILAAVLVAREEDGEALLAARGVGLSQNAHHLGVREPGGDFFSCAQTFAEFGARDVEGANARGDLVDGGVFVRVGQVRHHLERYDFDAELGAVLFHRELGIVGSVEVAARAVLPGAGVVAPNDEVSGAVVFADDGVPDCFAGPTHAHG